MSDSTQTPTFAVPEGYAPDPSLAKKVKAELEAKGVEYLFSTFVDVHGIPKSKVNPIAAFDKMAGGSELFTVGACEGLGLVGPHQDECAAVPDISTATICPWEERYAYFFGDLYYHGAPYENDPRQILKRQLQKAKDMGFTFNLGLEPEFFVLKEHEETGKLDTLAVEEYKGMGPCYDVNQALGSMAFLDPMVKAMNKLGYGVMSFDQEGGRGQFEFDGHYADALTTSDRFIFLRLMAKQYAKQLGYFATYMPKPFAAEFRSGCHFNMSLADAGTGENLFDPSRGKSKLAEKYGIPISDLAYHFTAGILKHAPALTAITSPTYNSYQGFIAQGAMDDVSWAPVLIAYGKNNRSAMMRMPLNRYCVENRAPDMSCNPYLAAAVQLAAGLKGIEEALDPGKPLNESAYNLSKREMKKQGMHFIPGTLLHALDALDADPLMDEVLGDMKDFFYDQKMTEWETEFYMIHPQQLKDRLHYI